VNPSVKGKITVSLRNKPVDEALAMVSNLSGLVVKKVNETYVIAPRKEMKETLERMGVTKSVNLTNMTAKSAADLAMNAFPDLTAREQGSAVALIGAPEDIEAAEALIRKNDSLTPDNAKTSIRVPVKHRPAGQIVTALTKMSPGIKAEAAGDTVVISGTRTEIDFARNSIELMDLPQGRAEVETRVYVIRHSPAEGLIAVLEKSAPEVSVTAGPETPKIPQIQFNPLGSTFIGGGSQNGGQGGAGGGGQRQMQQQQQSSGEKEKRPLSLVLRGSPANLDEAFKILRLVDTPPQLMSVEARIVETSPENFEQYGLKWRWTRFGFYEAPEGTTVSTEDGGIGSTDFTKFFTVPSNIFKNAFTRVPWSFDTILSAMVTKRDAKILASPNISVLNDHDASIFIGDHLRFTALATSSPVSGNVFTVVEVPVGIILLVHPRVNGDGQITLRVKPVVSTVSGFVDGVPQTSTREAETVVRVKDGDTLVIGGLIRDEDVKTMTKVPILGDLPLVGQLFRYHERNHRRSEVMIFLTIKMVN
jgi:type II secretory pathway component GspD/PulD (secretin)